MHDHQSPSILRLAQVMLITGLSRSSIYSYLNPKSKYFQPDFPRSVKIGPRATGWISDQVFTWINTRS